MSIKQMFHKTRYSTENSSPKIILIIWRIWLNKNMLISFRKVKCSECLDKQPHFYFTTSYWPTLSSLMHQASKLSHSVFPRGIYYQMEAAISWKCSTVLFVHAQWQIATWWGKVHWRLLPTMTELQRFTMQHQSCQLDSWSWLLDTREKTNRVTCTLS